MSSVDTKGYEQFRSVYSVYTRSIARLRAAVVVCTVSIEAIVLVPVNDEGQGSRFMIQKGWACARI